MADKLILQIPAEFDTGFFTWGRPPTAHKRITDFTTTHHHAVMTTVSQECFNCFKNVWLLNHQEQSLIRSYNAVIEIRMQCNSTATDLPSARRGMQLLPPTATAPVGRYSWRARIKTTRTPLHAITLVSAGETALNDTIAHAQANLNASWIYKE